jgi:predicted lipoprotein
MYRHLLLSMSFGVFLFSACSGNQTPSSASKNTDVSLKQEVLTKFDTLVLSTLDNYYVAYEGLQEKVKDWQASPTDLTLQQKAQEAWSSTMGIWQQIEMVQVSALCVSDKCQKGADFRDQIYAWPLSNLCKIDQMILNQEITMSTQFANKLPNTYGLGTLEVLLFDQKIDHHCPSAVGIDESWQQLGEAEIWKRRASYALHVVDYGQQVNLALKTSWQGIADQDVQVSLDEIFSALMYLDLMVKDDKIGIPAGIHIDCEAEDICVDRVEFVYAPDDIFAIEQNLKMTRKMIEIVFQPLLKAQGSESMEGSPLDERLLASIDKALSQTTAIGKNIEDALQNRLMTVIDLHASLKEIITLLRSEMMTRLNLSVPKEGASDND